MGNWNISINGTGAHHNQDNPGDANKRFHEFVKRLKEDGHSIQAATFTSGSSEAAEQSGCKSRPTLSGPKHGTA